MSKRSDKDLLADIQEAVQRIKTYIQDLNYDAFLGDSKTQDAVFRNLEILGEAAKNLSHAFRKKYPTIPWKSMAGLRDRLIHHYFGVNLDVIWHIIHEEMAVLAFQLEEIAKQEESGNQPPR